MVLLIDHQIFLDAGGENLPRLCNVSSFVRASPGVMELYASALDRALSGNWGYAERAIMFNRMPRLLDDTAGRYIGALHSIWENRARRTPPRATRRVVSDREPARAILQLIQERKDLHCIDVDATSALDPAICIQLWRCLLARDDERDWFNDAIAQHLLRFNRYLAVRATQPVDESKVVRVLADLRDLVDGFEGHWEEYTRILELTALCEAHGYMEAPEVLVMPII